ncbi:MAG: UDP-N-acetylmuramate--L-alanine ligase, partial [Fibrobacterota bacterium]
MKRFTKKIHMLGIGGAGMCPLAEVLQAHGHIVTGSDKSSSAATDRLESIGIKVQYNHNVDLVKHADLLVYSSAVRENNPERVYAREHGISCIRRAEMLGDLMRAHFTVCISGTHGKTTTTSLVGTILHDASMRPTVLVGGMVRSNESHAFVGNSNIMVAEADEYDRSFLAMNPSIAIITNIEADHLDCYGSIEAIKEAFVKFTERIPFYGAVVACKDDTGVREILPLINGTVITYSIHGDADYVAKDITFVNGSGVFTLVKQGVELGKINLNIPGKHNVSNSLAAIAVALEMGVDYKTVALSLAQFQGVKRRFEVIGIEKNITVIDDYAHHPGEIRATLDAARTSGYKNIIAVFQP